jgi:hypothetical protein
VWAELALAAWAALSRDTFRSSWRSANVLDGPRGRPAAAWPLAQVLWAAAEVRVLGGDPPLDLLSDALRPLRSGKGFAATRRGTRYFDDNAWLGLAFLRLAVTTGDPTWQQAARDLAGFVASGEDPDGGVHWAEGSTSRNTCSTASAAWLVLDTGTPGAAAMAGRWMDWLDRNLRRPDGLYGDRVDGDVVHDEVWTYNQGAALAATRSLGRPFAALRSAILDHWSAQALWREPPAFAAIAYRALLAGPNPDEVIDRWDPYLHRLDDEAREPTGWFRGGGVGRYDERPTLDQAAVVQMFALRAAFTNDVRRSPA